jgi:hypothetical protein
MVVVPEHGADNVAQLACIEMDPFPQLLKTSLFNNTNANHMNRRKCHAMHLTPDREASVHR